MRSSPVAEARAGTPGGPVRARSGTLRFALIGCGELGRDVHVPNLGRMRGVELAALVDPVEERSAAAESRSPGAARFPSVDDLVAAELVDAALVATPPETHAELARRLVDAGVAVYLEKPLAMHVREAEALYRDWKEAPVPFMMGLNFRHEPVALRLKALAAAGRAGRVRHVRTLFSIPPETVVSNDWRGTEAGSVLVELGSHHFDLVSFVTGRPVESVHALGFRSSGRSQTAVVVLHLEGGIVAECCLAFGLTLEDRWEVRGPQGVLAVNRTRGSGVRFTRAVPRPVDALAPLRELASLPSRLAALGRRLTLPWGERSFPAALESFAQAILTGRQPSPGIEEGLELVRIVDAARRSFEVGGPVPVER